MAMAMVYRVSQRRKTTSGLSRKKDYKDVTSQIHYGFFQLMGNVFSFPMMRFIIVLMQWAYKEILFRGIMHMICGSISLSLQDQNLGPIVLHLPSSFLISEFKLCSKVIFRLHFQIWQSIF